MGLFYEKTSLQGLGLVIQLGHCGLSELCPCPGPIQKDFVVVNLSGIHIIAIQFCACHHTSGGSASHVQLLRFCCFPSTIIRPQSTFTFDILNTFHLLTLQGKVSAYKFYCALQHKTNNTGILDAKMRFHWPWRSEWCNLYSNTIDNFLLSSACGVISSNLNDLVVDMILLVPRELS